MGKEREAFLSLFSSVLVSEKASVKGAYFPSDFGVQWKSHGLIPSVCPPPFPRLRVSPFSATLPQPCHEGILSGFDTVWVALT